MSGLMGAKGPGILGKVFGGIEKKYQSKEKPGFSGTKVQDKDGNWVSIDAGLRGKRHRAKGAAVFSGIPL